MRRIIAILLLATITLSVTGCDSAFFTGETPSEPNSPSKSQYFITVNYYDTVTRTYTVNSGNYLQAEKICPSGKIIIGLFDADGVQYADSTCTTSVVSDTFPAQLYAKYLDVSTEKINFSGDILMDENPTTVSFYKTYTLTWDHKSNSTSEEKEFIEACECNPYADLTITLTFAAKGAPTSMNELIVKLNILDETVASITKSEPGNSYTTYTLTATIKAKQLTNADYKAVAKATSKLGYDDYIVKNFDISYQFDFD